MSKHLASLLVKLANPVDAEDAISALRAEGHEASGIVFAELRKDLRSKQRRLCIRVLAQVTAVIAWLIYFHVLYSVWTVPCFFGLPFFLLIVDLISTRSTNTVRSGNLIRVLGQPTTDEGTELTLLMFAHGDSYARRCAATELESMLASFEFDWLQNLSIPQRKLLYRGIETYAGSVTHELLSILKVFPDPYSRTVLMRLSRGKGAATSDPSIVPIARECLQSLIQPEKTSLLHPCETPTTNCNLLRTVPSCPSDQQRDHLLQPSTRDYESDLTEIDPEDLT